MRKALISLFCIFCVFYLACCSTSDEHEKEIKDACKSASIILNRIEFVDSIDSQATKEKIKRHINSIDSAVYAIGDSTLVSFLYPSAYDVKRELGRILALDDYAYLRYKVYGITNGYSVEKYALISYQDSLICPVKIVDINDETELDFQLKECEYSFTSVMEYLSVLSSKSEDELQEMREEKLKSIEEQRKADEERRNAPKSWDEVAMWMKKKGYTIIGIYKGALAYAGTLVLYKKGSSTYLSSCSISSNPVDFEFANKLTKLNSNTYQYNEPGSDMPERYVISGSELVTYCYNPDVYEWVNMGSYHQIY